MFFNTLFFEVFPTFPGGAVFKKMGILIKCMQRCVVNHGERARAYSQRARVPVVKNGHLVQSTVTCKQRCVVNRGERARAYSQRARVPVVKNGHLVPSTATCKRRCVVNNGQRAREYSQRARVPVVKNGELGTCMQALGTCARQEVL